MNPNSLKNLTHRYKKGNSVWNKGIKGLHLNPATEFKKGRKDEKHPEWKGKNASYSAFHQWVKRWKGIPKVCQMCGTKKAKRFEWANVDHKYCRVLEDYISMCSKCHFAYDVNVLGSKRSKKNRK